MSDAAAMEHPVVFAHLAVADLRGAAEFYRSALHWATEDVVDGAGNVVMVRCSTGSKPNVGLVPGTGGTGGVALYLLCDDLAASARAWTAAGGTAGQPEAFAELGERVAALDPWGNSLMLWAWAPGRGWRPTT